MTAIQFSPSECVGIRRAEDLLRGYGLALDAGAVTRIGPKWAPGDVVVVRFLNAPFPYTYVRGAQDWPGDRAKAKTDAELSKLWAEGRVELKLRAGGRPWYADEIPAGGYLAQESTPRRTDRVPFDHLGRRLG